MTAPTVPAPSRFGAGSFAPVEDSGPQLSDDAIRTELAAELSRRDLFRGAGGIGLAALVAGAIPALELLADPEPAAAAPPLDASLEAFFDTIIPGRVVTRTQLGNPVTEGAILGVDREPGAVEADALKLANDGRIGFAALAPAFVAELETRALSKGGPMLSLGYEARQAACIEGLDFSNPTRVVWEAAAAIPFTAFCAAANTVDATAADAVGYQVMGHPGTAPRGYRNASYRRRLARERTRNGSLP
jgi:hypothetical protein